MIISEVYMFDSYPDVVKPKDIQSMLSVCKATAYKLVHENVIPSVRVGREYRIPKLAVINYLQISSDCGIMDRHTVGLSTKKEDVVA
jgi:excisionase family DNA binding protein